jgi:agmatine/peptidylarginine deiminase
MSKVILPLGVLLFQLVFATSTVAQYPFNQFGQRYQGNYSNQYQQRYQQQPYQQRYQQPYQQPQNYTPQPTPQKNTPTPASIIRYAAKPIEGYQPFPRMPGEFEPQKAVLLSVSDLMPQHFTVLEQIVEKTAGRIPLVILYNDGKQLKDTVELLDGIGCNLDHVSLYKLKLDTIWLRDFGPRVAETKNGSMSIDFFYNGQRPLDDKFPISWGKAADAELKKVTWTLQGGNMTVNGKGLCIVSSRLFEDNFIAFPGGTVSNVEYERRKIVVDAFKEDCNINQMIVLEPLRPEATRHVDMFTTFLAPDRILVASVDPRRDPVNARILDNNVALLKQVKVDGKPLRVERIEVPIRQDKYWSPYTNIIMANKTILFPIYKSDPPSLIRNAKKVYSRLMPGYHVDTVDMTSMQKLEGALHCLSINLPSFGVVPKGTLSFAKAKRKVESPGFVADDSRVYMTPDGKIIKNPNASPKVASNQKKQRNKQGATSSSANKSATAKSPFGERANSNVNARRPTAEEQQQLQAVMTYRRKFVDDSKTFMVEAFAIGFQLNNVVLLREDSRKQVLVQLEKLCREDREWLFRNKSKIVTNGPKIKMFLESLNTP